MVVSSGPHLILPSHKPGEHIEACAALAAPRPGKLASISQLRDLLTGAIGAVSTARGTIHGPESPWKVLDDLEHEFRNRLGLKFLVSDPVPRKRLGLVHCVDYRMSLELLLHSNIDLVVFDQPGSCTEDPHGPRAHSRTYFHPVDPNPDEGFLLRVMVLAPRARPAP
ncbi:hypothetical protein CC80DRAFT_506960 [Byssothecium circinans]|uniref:Uncharacterized protein n=1 Tax=Byssothecium circinans TaxID=147558 RepID=A0A6A5TPZ3_9PLEO|nr:hypothetical protein CC80DRAFT_506960 [Byssothecium circinans]